MVQKFPKRDECRILYHITLKENLDSILDKGLIPDIGSQCTHCKNDNPTEKLVYMTDLEGIAKWKKALYGNSNSCVILEVNTLNLEDNLSQKVLLKELNMHVKKLFYLTD